MTRHASMDQLALLAVGELRRRKAARLEAHAAGCAQCTQVRRELTAVSVTLADASYPSLPDRFSVRIQVGIASESAERVAAAPATEAGRRDLPTRQTGRRAGWRGWRIPGLSIPATRAVTGAAALALIAGGGYALATNVGAGGTGTVSTSSGAPAALAGPARQLKLGPEVTYGPPGATRMIQSVRSTFDFDADHLPSQVAAAVRTAQLKGASPASAPVARAPSAANSTSAGSSAAGSAAAGSGTASQLSGCINLIAPGRTLLLVELATYEGRPATVVVTAGSGSSPTQAWVVGESCSATSSDVLAHISLGNV